MNYARLFRQGADAPTRRAFLSSAAKGLLGVGTAPLWLGRHGMPSIAEAAAGGVPSRAGTARNVIYLYMSGGMSQLDTLDPKPGAPTQGPTESIHSNVDGIRVAGHFSNLAKQMDKLCLFRGMHSTQGAHEQGRYFLHTSYELRGTIRHPSMGAWLDRLHGRINPALPGHVAIGAGNDTASAGFMESIHGPVPIGNPSAGLQNSQRPAHVDANRAARRIEKLNAMNRDFATKHDRKDVRAYADMFDEAIRLMDSRDLEAFDIRQEPEEIREAYGDSKFGQGCLLARRLVESGVRFVEVQSGGWDTHDQNFDRMEDLCPPLDRTLSTLLTDLEMRGLLDETLVVLATEFGRTPDIVGARNGRNHYPKAFSCALAGGGVRGGRVWGQTDEHGREVVENKTSIPDFNATIAWALGLPLEHVETSPSQRPFTVADKGQPITEVFV